MSQLVTELKVNEKEFLTLTYPFQFQERVYRDTQFNAEK